MININKELNFTVKDFEEFLGNDFNELNSKLSLLQEYLTKDELIKLIKKLWLDRKIVKQTTN